MTQGDRTEYLYADPVVCGCLYAGDEKALNAYNREVLQLKLADALLLRAQTYSPDWDWGAWSWQLQ